jgi:hypothetical protein
VLREIAALFIEGLGRAAAIQSPLVVVLDDARQNFLGSGGLVDRALIEPALRSRVPLRLRLVSRGFTAPEWVEYPMYPFARAIRVEPFPAQDFRAIAEEYLRSRGYADDRVDEVLQALARLGARQAWTPRHLEMLDRFLSAMPNP